MRLEVLEDVDFWLGLLVLLTGLSNDIVDVFPLHSRVLEDLEEIDECVLDKHLVVNSEVNSVQLLRGLHGLLCAASMLVLRGVLEPGTNLKESLVITLLQIQLEKRLDNVPG